MLQRFILVYSDKHSAENRWIETDRYHQSWRHPQFSSVLVLHSTSMIPWGALSCPVPIYKGDQAVLTKIFRVTIQVLMAASTKMTAFWGRVGSLKYTGVSRCVPSTSSYMHHTLWNPNVVKSHAISALLRSLQRNVLSPIPFVTICNIQL
jgi:hypothetical protein